MVAQNENSEIVENNQMEVFMFWDKFVSLCVEVNKSPNSVAKELSISSGSVTNWKSGILPRSTTASKIADYFGVSVDYLLGNTDKKEKPTVNDDGLSEGQRELIEFAKSVPEDKVDLILKVMKSIVESP